MEKFKHTVMDVLEAIAWGLILVMLLFTFVCRTYQVDGHSMDTTLAHQDRILVSHLFYTPKQGDIVCFVAKDLDDRILVKRVIATAGQTIDVNTQNQVVVDGEVLEEDYLNTWMYTESNGFAFPYTVQRGEVFCLGDNRTNSRDSRDLGPIETEYLLGKMIVRLAPNFGVVK